MKKNGFTLVELSIVLVIIGMLVGGILIGQSLIDSAKLGATVRQLEQYDAAVFSFKSKYRALPGDSRMSYTVAVCCGTDATKDNLITDNDRINNTVRYAVGGSEEYMLFWLELAALTGLKIENCPNLLTRANVFAGGDGIRVSGDNCNFPKLKYGSSNNTILATVYDLTTSGYFDASNTDGNAFYLVDCKVDGSGPNQICEPGFTQAEAMSLDGKMDDGIPNRGEVEAFSNTGYTMMTRSDKSRPSSYNTASTTKLSVVRKFAKGLK